MERKRGQAMSYCNSCGNQVQPDWANCPHCSAPLGQVIQQVPDDSNLDIQLVEKRWFPFDKLVVQFTDPMYGISDQIVFSGFRTYTPKTASGFVLGKLQLQGLTVMSGAQGLLRFQNGTTYSAVLKIGLTGMEGISISDLTDGRRCMIDF